MANIIPYKSFCWCLGTTSFRTKNFNKTIEEQLILLDEFWKISENEAEQWESNAELQSRYYDFMKEKNFVKGKASNKPKDSREKTSGLVDIGLINSNRHVTKAGESLLKTSKLQNFKKSNPFRIESDSYIYLKQLLKTTSYIDENIVRPFIILAYLLTKLEYLTKDEFTYLLPLCIGNFETEEIIRGIKECRHSKKTMDDIIISRLMEMDNYKAAKERFFYNKVTENLICEIGLNRKSRSYDKSYFTLYKALCSFYVKKDHDKVFDVYLSTKEVKLGKYWRSLLFDTSSSKALEKNPIGHLKYTKFNSVESEEEFKLLFFEYLHLYKAKATLEDYYDLNRRYIKTTDVIMFEDGEVKFDIIPKYFFANVMEEFKNEAYKPIDKELLYNDCPIENISSCLIVDNTIIINAIKSDLGIDISTVEEAQDVLEDNRYKRLNKMIDQKFTNKKLLKLLHAFEKRRDRDIQEMVTDGADIPTIFEYVLGIIWYKVSERSGKILDYMKLSLDADLLPKTHAAGGEADIVYEYQECASYPKHTLLLEATLADNTNQRRMEMEPVSRHLGNYLIRTRNMNSYCLFITTYLNINVISDFRSRKNNIYYDSQDYSQYIDEMKIIPLETTELRKILESKKTYKELYTIFEKNYQADLSPHKWYENLKENVNNII
jgi:hypothetical protein